MFEDIKRKIKMIFTPAVKIKGLVSFELWFTHGWFCNADWRYGLKSNGSEYIAYVKPLGKDDDGIIEFAVEPAFVSSLEKLFTDNKVGRWNGFNKANTRVVDGKSFRFSLTNAKGDKLKASGYMKWPKNYAAVRMGVEQLFEGRYENTIV